MSTSSPLPSEIGGYILAGGKSSRMGTDKALLELAGKPLIRHAVKKLRRVCMDVRILSSNPALADYAPLVPDLHPNTGPIGGIEAALAHSIFNWNLILPVDIPFLPTAFIDHWVRNTIAEEKRGVRIALYTVDGIPQPTLLMIHRDAAPYISQAVERSHFKLFPVLEAAGRDLATQRGLLSGYVFNNAKWGEGARFRAKGGIHSRPWQTLTEAQQAAQPFWFANLNTPEDFAEAEARAGALDT
jgi:molybdenum cofactor guanylyltransferase